MIRASGFRLGDGGEIKAQMFIRIPNAQFSTSAPLLPNRCYLLGVLSVRSGVVASPQKTFLSG